MDGTCAGPTSANLGDQQRVNRRPSQRIIKVMLDLTDHNVAAPTRWYGAIAYGLSVKELVICLLAQPMDSPVALAVCAKLNANPNEKISACT